MSRPLSMLYAPNAPLVAFTPFLRFHDQAVSEMIGRPPSAFMRATAHSLWIAYAARMAREGEPRAFTAVSAATGSGKSLAACALIAHLVETEGATCAYVVETIEAVEEVRGFLEKLMPGRVAAYSSIHRANAAPDKVRDYAAIGVTTEAHYTEEQFLSAAIVVTTHDRWKRDLTEARDYGVLKCRGVERSLVVVDEEPEIQVTFQRQPEDVSALASILTDRQLAGEARSYGFASSHHAAEALLAVHDRMRKVKDNVAVPQIMATTDLVTAEDARHFEAVTRDDLARRLWGTEPALMEFHWETVQFLLAAAEGRVFYSKDEGGAFHAYAFRLPVKARHIVLDGTADLNGMYAVGSHVVTVESERPSYRNLALHAVQPPREFRRRMRNDGLLRDVYAARPFMEWLFRFIEEHTVAGDRVLIYGKKKLLDFGLHTMPEFDESRANDRMKTTWRGRELHWVNFGRGRGLNKWKDCNVYIRLGDFHMKRAVAVANVGSIARRTFKPSELRFLSSRSARDPEVSKVLEMHLAVTNKQDAARSCIRNLADDGACPPARAYMVDCNLSLLMKYQERMFPGAEPYKLIGYEERRNRRGRRGEAFGAAATLAEFLLTTERGVVTPTDAYRAIGLRPGNFARALRSHSVGEAMQARGWTLTTRKAQGLPGKGRLLVRSTNCGCLACCEKHRKPSAGAA